VPLDTLGAAQTVLLRKPTAADMKGITGNALFSFVPVIDWKLSLLLSAALLLAVFLLRAGLWHRAKYFLYAGSAKKELHGFRTLINDGLVHLGASDLDHAMMRYKEAKLTYERLSPYAKNEAYSDLEHFCSALDSAYFSLLADRIKEALDRGSLTDAIDDFQRLEATYERLSPEEQETLLLLVYELGRRLGVNDEDVSAASSGASMSGSLSSSSRPASGGGA